MFKLILLSILCVSCLKRPESSDAKYITKEKRDESIRRDNERRAEEVRRAKELFERQAKEDLENISLRAQNNFEFIKPVLSYKCFDCHNENRKLPIYGRILRRFNPVYQHQVDGLNAIDLSLGFPIKTSKGYTPTKGSLKLTVKNLDEQKSYLEAIKESVVKRTMPLVSYRRIYRNRQVFDQDEMQIVNWVEPIINDINEYQRKYSVLTEDDSIDGRVLKIFNAKCVRCHGNGKEKGGFGDIEKLPELLKSKYIDFKNPEKSELYEEVESGDMPKNKNERLTTAELNDVLDWIRQGVIK